MSGPVGHTFIYNLIILFVVIVFSFLAGTMSYYKAFKINNRIVSSIEKFEGYNTSEMGRGGSIEEINRTLSSFGYSIVDNFDCPDSYKKMNIVAISDPINGTNGFKYCVYSNNLSPSAGTYYQYGVLTYMNIDIPFVNKINIPVFTRTNLIYKFTNE